jgi:hypothetical protein
MASGVFRGAEEGEPLATPERGPEARAHHFPKVTPGRRVMPEGRVPLTYRQEATEEGKVVLHLQHLWRYWQLVRCPQLDVPIKSKHRSAFATPVGLNFGFTGSRDLPDPSEVRGPSNG